MKTRNQSITGAFTLAILAMVPAAALQSAESITLGHQKPANGDVFSLKTTMTRTGRMSASAEGQPLPDQPFPGSSVMTVSSHYDLKVLGVESDTIRSAELLLRQAEVQMKPRPDNQFTELMRKQSDTRGKPQRQSDPLGEVTPLIGKPVRLAVNAGQIEATTADEQLLPSQTATMLGGLISAGVSTPKPPGRITNVSLTDPRLSLSHMLPHGKSCQAGRAIEIPHEAVSEWVDAGTGLKPEDVTEAQTELVETRDIDGVLCAVFKLSIKAKGGRPEPFGGVPSSATISRQGRIVVEVGTGWLREFELESDQHTDTAGNFQGVKMTMTQGSRSTIKTTITPLGR